MERVRTGSTTMPTPSGCSWDQKVTCHPAVQAGEGTDGPPTPGTHCALLPRTQPPPAAQQPSPHLPLGLAEPWPQGPEGSQRPAHALFLPTRHPPQPGVLAHVCEPDHSRCPAHSRAVTGLVHQTSCRPGSSVHSPTAGQPSLEGWIVSHCSNAPRCRIPSSSHGRSAAVSDAA